MKVIYIQDQHVTFFKGEVYHPKSEHFFERFLSGMKEDEILTVYAGMREEINEDIIKKYKCVSHKRIKYEEIPEFRKLTNIPKIRKKTKEIVKNADYCYLRCGIASSFAAYYCNKYHIPYMAIVNEDIFKSNICHSSFIVKLSAYPLLLSTRYLVKNADFACYVTKDYLQRQYPCKGLSVGCSDIEFLDINNDALTRRINKIEQLSEPIVLGSVGNISTVIKGHDTAIKALAALKQAGFDNFEYQLVGSGKPDKITKLASDLGVLDKIRLLGVYKHDEVLKWFETIDIYLHPSRSEGLPRTILEAMTKATPCICSSVGGIPELIDKHFLFNYDGNEVESLKTIILSMTKLEMKEQAKLNFEHSKDYKPEILAERRNEFFEKAIETIKK